MSSQSAVFWRKYNGISMKIGRTMVYCKNHKIQLPQKKLFFYFGPERFFLFLWETAGRMLPRGNARSRQYQINIKNAHKK